MFKTITAFLLADSNTRVCLNSTNLPVAIPEPTVRDPDATQWWSIGFAHPDYFGDSPVFVGAEGTRVFNVQLRERVLPGKVIRTKLLERAAEIAERQGYKCGRKQMAELKDEIVAALLPTAFIKPVDVLCMIAGNYLIIGTGSARMVDLVLKTLREAYPNDTLLIHSISRSSETSNWMTELLLEGTTGGGIFTCGSATVLRNAEKATARFKDMDLHKTEIQQHVASGMKPIEIAVNYKDRVMFALSDHLVIKRIRLTDILMEEAGEASDEGEVSPFDTTVALMAGEMRELLDNLLSEMPEEDEL